MPEERSWKGRIARWMMTGAEEWSLRSVVVIAVLMVACAAGVFLIRHLDAAQQPGPSQLKPVVETLEASEAQRRGPWLLDAAGGSRFQLPRSLRTGALKGRLRLGQSYTFYVGPDCGTEGPTARCDVWRIQQDSRELASYALVRGAWDGEQQVPYILLVSFFSLGAVFTGTQIWMRLAGWKPTIPDPWIPAPTIVASHGEAMPQDTLDRWLEEAQEEIKRGDRRITYAVLLAAGGLLAATRIHPDAWHRPVSMAWVAGLFSAVFLAIVGVDVIKQRRPLKWMKAKAQVYHVSVLHQDNAFIPAVLYEYRAGGRVRRSFRVHVNGPRNRLVEAIQNAKQYAAGTEVECYYDPARPEQAVLTRRFQWTTARVSLVFCVGLWAFAYFMG